MIASFADAATARLAQGWRVRRFAGDDQYRVCFRWTAAGAAEVEIVDYHWR
jgi:plasmid maintenance system killer protein